MTEDTFITHCNRGVLIARRGHEVIDPILEILQNAEDDVRKEGGPEDAELAESLKHDRQALADWVQDVSELIVDLTNDYLERDAKVC